MPDRFLGKTLEITLHATQESSARAYVWHFHYDRLLPPSPTECVEVATNFWAAIQSSWNGLHSTTVNAYDVTCKDISFAGGAIGIYYIPQPHPGAYTGTAAPANVAGVISWRTGVASRSGRGRTYICGVSQTAVTGSLFVSTWLTAAAVFATVVAAFTNSGGSLTPLRFHIVSFTHEFSNPVSSFIVDNFVDSQRRRLIGRGS